ncbi:alkaline shock response membrane anchor protein AmaP [Paenibacillus aurantius]|uniref:Alkaline shock response membrane anchor protein AmaP n=1 Tax=Paenibacillus aurantius TaxID=2918900 RepID=A0AA96LA79_9BACL|nr:alkaline shock response membrane anchor protein AmaP [Paenibacillus aurantius]WJH34291.1 alkaline shock response membrane anchor protein AmaP [Paenibacillus sp. CC-CFT747]WNQ09394.1 alkaline shock response membrane anchor protein AmaP [Paenibacillus aurantius]
MAKFFDRFLLLLFSLASIIALVSLLLSAFGLIPYDTANAFLINVYRDEATAVAFITCSVILLLIAVRMLILAVRTGGGHAPSIDQRTEFGDIRISMETVENLALKSAGRTRGVKDLKSRVKVIQAGLDIEIRTIVDGETSIPVMTEEIQAAVKEHIEEITGIPVANVSVYVANVVQNAHTFKSRVE